MDSIQEKILRHIVKTNQCAKWPKELKPYMKTQCGQCPLKLKCWDLQKPIGDSRPVSELAKEVLEEAGRH